MSIARPEVLWGICSVKGLKQLGCKLDIRFDGEHLTVCTPSMVVEMITSHWVSDGEAVEFLRCQLSRAKDCWKALKFSDLLDNGHKSLLLHVKTGKKCKQVEIGFRRVGVEQPKGYRRRQKPRLRPRYRKVASAMN